ncbi:MAG: diacylglycerol/lipid kinase family protein, partial [Flavobacteriales bacterium]
MTKKRLALIAHGLHWKRWNEKSRFDSLSKNYDLHYYITESQCDAFEFAQQCSCAGFEYLISYGGDGTLHQVINGMLSSGMPGEELPKIIILPRGSGNDYVRTLSTCESVDELLGLLDHGQSKGVDVGCVEF